MFDAKLPPLLKASKLQEEPFLHGSSSVIIKPKTNKELLIDKKIERLLEVYKQQDDDRARKVHNLGEIKK